ncbi:spike base protein, RCAP_Rcc01079 family [Paraburkholderia dioscoreae]|uniref:Uncharacterized protein n=1 Tax=Paraburkholderia dioscoreae TaxID=2604047 RepID=A0A5Q4ZMH8_9BURK|nr:hypothetical protein [Paraburkholderia dioscoreae]VVD29146.1 conserved protein of unknown function [Paraburkholderia dioscoreae]
MNSPTLVPDAFLTYAPQLDSPAGAFYLVTPSNSDLLPSRPRALRVGIAGDVTLTGMDGVDVLFKNCYAGEILDVRPVQIKAAGTTAQNIVALL